MKPPAEFPGDAVIESPAQIGAQTGVLAVAMFGMWRLVSVVLSSIQKSEERCLEQFTEVSERLVPVVERNTEVLSRVAERWQNHETVFHTRGETMTVLENPNDEPIYTIPPGEREPESTVRIDMLPDTRDWGHEVLGLKALHEAGFTGEGVSVAVLDTGCDRDHPGLVGMVESSKDYTGSPIGGGDRQGHGTHCASTIAEPANGTGMIGVAPAAKVQVHKVLGDTGSGLSSWIAAGIRGATAARADVISMSLGGPSPDSATRSAINEAVAANVWIAAAAGNDGPGASNSFPGNYPNVVCVGAIGPDLAVARFSSRNVQVDVAAPGVSIRAAFPGNRYATMSGTSMATPYVAGVLALVRGELKKNNLPILPLERVMVLMKQTAKDLGPAGVDNASGAGLIQPKALIEAVLAEARGAQPNPNPTPNPDPKPNPSTITLSNSELTAAGITSIVVGLAQSQKPDPTTPKDGLIEMPPALRLALRALLPILRSIAQRTKTEIDDFIVKVLEAALGVSRSERVLSATEMAEWLDYAGRILQALLPILRELAQKTATPWDDFVLDLVQRLLTKSRAEFTAAQLTKQSRSFAVAYGLIDEAA